MSKIEIIKGIMKTFWILTKEDWDELDHKLLRIATGAIGFVIMALLWYYLFRNVSPFF